MTASYSNAAPSHRAADDSTFDDLFIDDLDRLLRWRRDVRHFRREPLAAHLLPQILAAAELSPSVGNSQPWRWVEVRSPERRAAVRENFLQCNAEALQGYAGDRARLYSTLKLAGLDDAPVHLAVFCDTSTGQGYGLGRATIPATMEYSAAAATTTLWLAARARGVGVGWVSIIDPVRVTEDLDVPDDWTLVAYLCIGYPDEDADVPELERVGWQSRTHPENRHLLR